MTGPSTRGGVRGAAGILAVAALVCCAAATGAPAATAAPAVPARPGRARPAPSIADRYRAPAARLIGAELSSDRAYRRLSELCDDFGGRLSGSPALERAVRWAEREMKRDGLERVRLEPVMVPHWVRGEESAQMIAPRRLPLSILGLGRSVGTPPGGITGDVVVVGSFGQLDSLPDEAVRGRIVLYDVPFTSYGRTVIYRARGARAAAARGAVAALVRSVTPTSLDSPHTGAMSAYVDSLPRIPAAAVTIEDAEMIRRLVERGERVTVRLEMGARTLPDARSYNVIGEIRGRERPDEVVVVGAHLDSWDVGEGAQDDGDGCVIGMEALRLVRSLGLRPRRTLRCVLWVNEENGSRGGHAYADTVAHGRERHVAAIESDNGVERPLGFDVGVRRAGTDSTDDARTVAAVGLLEEIAPLLAGLGVDRMGPGGGETDIEPLMRLGVPGISLRSSMAHYFDWHHSRADMLDKVDPVQLRRGAAAVAVLAYVLADMPGTLAGAEP